MGIILSRFRKKKSSEEQLEDIQKNIEKLENDSKYILKQEKAIVFRLIFFSILIYIIAALLFYFYFFPASLWDRLFYIIPLLIFPIIIIVVKRSIKWLYDRDITNSRNKLKDLQIQKKQILDDVMNTETYKKAKDILDKYAPEQLRKSPSPTPAFNQVLMTPKKVENQQYSNQLNQPIQHRNSMSPVRPINAPLMRSNPTPRRLPRPLLPQDRSYLDRLMEAIVGDGPNNRYALICKLCSSHNGMALKEEFEYLSFRCAYCGFPNPSVKVRPREMPPGFTPLHAIEQKQIQMITSGEEREETEPEQEESLKEEIEDVSLDNKSTEDIEMSENEKIDDETKKVQ